MTDLTLPATARDVLLQAVADAARAAVLRRFRPDSCIATTRVVIETLRYFGVPARPWAVNMIMFNAAAWPLAVAKVPATDWPEDAWSVGFAAAGFAKDGTADPDNVGHVVALAATPAGRRMVDASIDQVGRPAKGIPAMRPMIGDVPAEFDPADQSVGLVLHEAGVTVIYTGSASRVFATSPHWRRADPTVRACTAETIRALQGRQWTDGTHVPPGRLPPDRVADIWFVPKERETTMTTNQPGITCPPPAPPATGRLITDVVAGGPRAGQFRDQAHLDRWYAYVDHTQACPSCGQPGAGYDAPDGWQPTVTQCAEAARLLNLV